MTLSGSGSRVLHPFHGMNICAHRLSKEEEWSEIFLPHPPWTPSGRSLEGGGGLKTKRYLHPEAV
eukprot:1392975-Karenia_brevis.AAC.1